MYKDVECRCLALLNISLHFSVIDCVTCRLQIAWPRTSSDAFSGQKEADDVHRGHLSSFAPFCHVGASGDTSEVLLFYCIDLYLFRMISVSSGIVHNTWGWTSKACDAKVRAMPLELLTNAKLTKENKARQSSTMLKSCLEILTASTLAVVGSIFLSFA